VFGTLSYPSHLARRARAAGIEPKRLGLRLLVTAGEPGAGLAAVRREIEDAWATRVADTFGMSDVWSTMAGECGQSEGLHVTTGDGALLELCDPEAGAPVELEDGATGELVWTHLEREASPLLRYRSADLARVWTRPCPCGHPGLRLRIEGRRDDMIRVRGANVHPQAVGAVLATRPTFGRYAVVAEGDPIQPPLRVLVEAPDATAAQRAEAEDELPRRLGATIALTTVATGTQSSSAFPLSMVEPRTASPTASPEAPSPRRSITPEYSWPFVWGKCTCTHGMVPRRTPMSNGCTPAARTRTRTSPGPGSGSGRSAMRRTSGGPKRSNTTALMARILQVEVRFKSTPRKVIPRNRYRPRQAPVSLAGGQPSAGRHSWRRRRPAGPGRNRGGTPGGSADSSPSAPGRSSSWWRPRAPPTR